jgi:hypothetical protein
MIALIIVKMHPAEREKRKRTRKISQMSYPNQAGDAVKYLLFPRFVHDKIFY